MTLEELLDAADENTWVTVCGDLSFTRVRAMAGEFTSFLRPKFLERRVDGVRATGQNEFMVWIADGGALIAEDDQAEKEGT